MIFVILEVKNIIDKSGKKPSTKESDIAPALTVDNLQTKKSNPEELIRVLFISFCESQHGKDRADPNNKKIIRTC